MEVVWTDFARAGLVKHVPAHARASVEQWITAKLRAEPWRVGRPTPGSDTARVSTVYAGANFRFLFDYDEQVVRVLSIAPDSSA
jgi:hypothetical protein